MNLSGDDHMSDQAKNKDESTTKADDKMLEDVQEDSKLPETVTILESINGVKVYLVGTAHFSKESQLDVKKTIQKVQPKVVMLELCDSRTSILSLDEEALLKEAGEMSFQKMSSSIKQHGMVQGMLQVLMLNMSVHLTKQLGMAPGGEFRTAFQEARKIAGCTIQLGDRPIRITLRRALSSLSFFQKLKLAFSLLFFNGSISKEDVEKCKQRDMLEELLMEMTGEFPSLSRVFVHERDIYLAHSLKRAAILVSQHCGTGAGGGAWSGAGAGGCCGEEGGEDGGGVGCCGGGHADDTCAKVKSGGDDDEVEDEDGKGGNDVKEKRVCCRGGHHGGHSTEEGVELAVVGVVGIGHCPGISKVWNEEHDIHSVLTVPAASRLGNVVRMVIRVSLLGMLGYGCYRAGKLAFRVIFPSRFSWDAVLLTRWTPKQS